MIKVAIFGYGTVGSGVFEVIRTMTQFRRSLEMSLK